VDADLDTLATALYVRIDDWLKTQPQWAPWRPPTGITPELSDAEALTLAVLQALLGHVSEARWLRFARRQLRHLFLYLYLYLYLPQQHGYNKRPRKLGGTMNWLIGMRAPRHLAVDRRRVGRGFHPGGMRRVEGDRAPLRPGRMGRVRLLRLPLALLLGAAAPTVTTAARQTTRPRFLIVLAHGPSVGQNGEKWARSLENLRAATRCVPCRRSGCSGPGTLLSRWSSGRSGAWQ
jgi:hypothetical protein